LGIDYVVRIISTKTTATSAVNRVYPASSVPGLQATAV
jgi:hypothetical protein